MAIAALTLALIAPASGQDGPAYLVRNINQSIDHRGDSWPNSARAIGPYIYFQADDGEHGGQWYRTDRTPAGTQSLAELGLPPPPPERSAEWPFSIHDGALWIADDTGAETRLTPEPVDGAWSEVGNLRILNGAALFVFCEPQYGCELWRSDGTRAGTGLLVDIDPAESGLSTNHPAPIVFGGVLYFAARTAATGLEPWRSDGTAAGTRLLRDLNPGPDDGLQTVYNGGPHEPSFVAARGALYFSANDGVHGFELWRSDGTTDGTAMLVDLLTGPLGAFDGGHDECDPHLLVTPAPDEGLFIAACVDHEYYSWRLWESDGSAAGTRRLDDFRGPLALAGDTLYYARHRDSGGDDLLRRRRGELPALVTTLPRIVDLTAVGGGLLLSVWEPRTGEEPWWSDGTAAGTYLLRDIRGDDADADPRDLIALGDVLLFSADDGVHGRELWRSDATAAGTTLVADLAPGPASSAPMRPVRLGDAIVFIADDGVHGAEPWRSDGTAAGTWLLADIRPGAASSAPSSFKVAGDRAFFFADDGLHGAEPWSSDGTPAGTRLVRDINPGAAPSLPRGREPGGYFDAAALDGALFFSADDGTHGSELWRSDGSESGTALLADIRPGAEGSNPGWYEAFPGRVMFWGGEWVTDGTAAGTQPTGRTGTWLYSPIASGDATYALGWDEVTDGSGVWRLEADGRAALIAPRTELDALFDVGGALFGIRSDEELWRLGAPLTDRSSGEPHFWDATDFAASGRHLLLYDDGYRSLWTTDGTPDGQVELQYLPYPEYRYWPPDREVRDFTAAGDAIFFGAAVGDLGRELWAIPVDVLPEVCIDDCPWMWTPTPTDTPESDTPTPTPPPTADCGDRCTLVSLDPVSGAPGDRVTLTARLTAEREPIAGLDLQLGFAPDVRIASTSRGRADCRVDESIAKPASTFQFTPYGCTPNKDCTGVRALIIALDNVDPIPDGVTLFTCRAAIADRARPGRREMPVLILGAADPNGMPVAAAAEPGAVTVLSRSEQAISGASAGGCQTGPANPGSPLPLLFAGAAWLWRRKRVPPARGGAETAKGGKPRTPRRSRSQSAMRMRDHPSPRR